MWAAVGITMDGAARATLPEDIVGGGGMGTMPTRADMFTMATAERMPNEGTVAAKHSVGVADTEAVRAFMAEAVSTEAEASTVEAAFMGAAEGSGE